jgi:hypothetical protein
MSITLLKKDIDAPATGAPPKGAPKVVAMPRAATPFATKANAVLRAVATQALPPILTVLALGLL